MGDSPNESVAILVISEKRPCKVGEKCGEGRGAGDALQGYQVPSDGSHQPEILAFTHKKRLTVRCTVTKCLPFGVNKNINISF